MHARHQTSPGPVQFDIWAIVRILRRRLWVVALTAFVLAGATAAYTLSVQPVYRASARLLIEPSVRQPFDNPNVPTRGGDDSLFVDSQVAVIASDTVLRPVARQFDLKNDAEFGADAEPGLLSSVLALLRGPGDAGTPAGEARRENEAVRAFGKAVAAKREGLTYVVSVTVDSVNPDKAAKLAQAVADSYLADRKRHQATSSMDVNKQIEQRLVGLRTRLRDAESAVERFKAENRLQSTGDAGLLSNQELGGLNTQLTEARAALAEKQARYDEITAFLKKGISPNSINEISVLPNVSNLRDQFTLASRAVANLEAELLPQHPRLIRAKSEVRRLEGLLRAEAQDAASAAKVELGVARERVANLERAVDTSRSQTNVGNTASIRLRELETEAETTRALYENALARTKEISELDQVVVPGARIIAPGLAWDSAVWPKKKLLVALAGFLGLLLGTAIAIGGEAIRQLSAQFRQAAGEADTFADEDVPGPVRETEMEPVVAVGEPDVFDNTVDLDQAPRKPFRPHRAGGYSLLNVPPAAE
ncbi:GumC family protein [Oricola nitratireducens]|uniref:GumC family protein n=1 Tax=Oricola nitratireducens TaxID=2775868 RepID=UPI0024860870|nr:GumC family protein [Oricola nitratireducens]